MIVSDVSMNAITGDSGREVTRVPLRRARLVTYPSAGARMVVCSNSHCARPSSAVSRATSVLTPSICEARARRALVS